MQLGGDGDGEGVGAATTADDTLDAGVSTDVGSIPLALPLLGVGATTVADDTLDAGVSTDDGAPLPLLS